ncbi:hypothetical protein [Streptomyces sp. NPDC059862]
MRGGAGACPPEDCGGTWGYEVNRVRARSSHAPLDHCRDPFYGR